MLITPFSAVAPGINVSATTTASVSVPLPGVGGSVRLVNEGPNTAYVAIGGGPQTATVPSGTASSTSLVLLAGYDEIFAVPIVRDLQISAITATGTAVLDIYVAEGV